MPRPALFFLLLLLAAAGRASPAATSDAVEMEVEAHGQSMPLSQAPRGARPPSAETPSAFAPPLKRPPSHAPSPVSPPEAASPSDELAWLSGEMDVEGVRAAADQGHAEAQHVMAALYSTGMVDGVEHDEARSILHDYFAAVGGSSAAALSLGHRYLNGIGVPRDCDTAISYLELAATETAEALGPLQEEPQERRERVEKLLTATRESDMEVVHYFQLAADMGNVDALVSLGQFSFFGLRGVERNYKDAAAYYRQAADEGSLAAASALGHMHLHGLGLNRDEVSAMNYFLQGITKNDPSALNGLGYMHLLGLGVEEDRDLALEYLTRAAQRGHGDALYNLGALFSGVGGGELDFVQAHHYYALAAKQGHLLATYRLAQLTQFGMGVTQSCSAAAHMFMGVAQSSRRQNRLFKEATDLFIEGDSEGALLRYALLAHEGYEVAQANAAWLLLQKDSVVGEQRAYRLYELASLQGNVQACVFLGDYHYYGLGNSTVDFKAALEHYRRGAKLRNAQAAFNVAYMHQYGIGMPQDYFLAKRLYDQAVEVDHRAWAPAALALTHMNVMQVLEAVGSSESREALMALVVAHVGADSLLIAVLVALLVAVGALLASR